MPLYLAKFSMTPEAWAKLIKEPEDRRETVGRLLEANGGKLLGFWYAFGDHDGYVLAEAPDNATMASALVTVAASGAFSSVSTTVLLSVEETLDVLRRAQSIAYRPPGG
ncbi:MAG TPA: GYD domain-containing protein [Actinomycetes bacterium]|nr:GYD domain-containing protein [Actinomycetes bacterium]